jgi:oxygen-independent coproporphyrinogen-3 oxidase
MKTGRLDLSYFQHKFGVDVWDEFKEVFEQLNSDALVERDEIRVVLTRKGLLQVDHFLSEFFEPELKAVRYV